LKKVDKNKNRIYQNINGVNTRISEDWLLHTFLLKLRKCRSMFNSKELLTNNYLSYR
jgi:hypothetical protein